MATLPAYAERSRRPYIHCYVFSETKIIMTYNFDPDKWYENERLILKAKCQSGEITKQEFKKALIELDKRHADIWNRLDGTFQIQKRRKNENAV